MAQSDNFKSMDSKSDFCYCKVYKSDQIITINAFLVTGPRDCIKHLQLESYV